MPRWRREVAEALHRARFLRARVERFDAGDDARASNALHLSRARSLAQSRAQFRIAAQAPDVLRESSGDVDSRPVTLVLDDVARAARVHRGNRDSERAGFDQHAAERFRPARRKDQQACAGQQPRRFVLVEPAGELDPSLRTLLAAASSAGRSGPSPTTTSGQSRSAR